MRFVFLILLLATTASAKSFHADPIHSRDLERQTKAEQARAIRKHMLVQDFSERPQVTVDGYLLDLEVFPTQGSLNGLVTAQLTATSDLTELTFDAVKLGIQKAWFIDANGVRSETQFDEKSEGVTVQLPVAIAPKTKFSVQFQYLVKGDKRDGRATETERGLYFVNGDSSQKDVVPSVYTSVEPELARTWFPCFDDPSMKAAHTTVTVKAPLGWYAVSNGRLKDFVDDEKDSRSIYSWEHGFPIPTYLISLAISPYTHWEDKWRDRNVQYFVPKALEEAARVDFARTPEMIEYYSSLWGAYPFEKYAIATAPNYGGAMEHTTATTLSEDLVTGDREVEDTLAHELSHHWWGDLATLATWDDLWLNEGFATYAEVLFAEKFKSKDEALEYMIWNRDSYVSFDSEGKKAVVDPEVSPDDKFSPAVYEKGAWVLHMLRSKLGDSAFFDGMNGYLQKYAFKNATTDQLRAEFEKASGQKLDAFFSQWVRGKGYPKLDMHWGYDPRTRVVRVTPVQTQAAVFEFPLEVMVMGRTANGTIESTVVNLNVTRANESFAFALNERMVEPVAVVADPNQKLLKHIVQGRPPSEIEALLESPEWQARLSAVKESEVSQVFWPMTLARNVAKKFSSEPSSLVRAEMLGVLSSAKAGVGFTDSDFQSFQSVIQAGLYDKAVDVRISAAKAAQNYLTPAFAEEIAKLFQKESAIRAKGKLAYALAESKIAGAFNLLYADLQTAMTKPAQRRLVIDLIGAFGKLRDVRAAAVLTDFVNGFNPYLRTVALENLGWLAVPATFDFIAGILNDTAQTRELRISSAKALANFGGLSSARVLNERLKIEDDEKVKEAIQEALDRLGGKPGKGEPVLEGNPPQLSW